MRFVLIAFLAILFVSLGFNIVQAEGPAVVIQKGKTVSFDYTLTVDGKVMDSSQGKSPLTYVHGDGKIIPGLAKKLEGLKVGDKKTIVVLPEEAYGLPDPKAFKDVPIASLPPNIKPAVGMSLMAQNPNGGAFPVKITEVKKDSVIVDFNHPLAGKTLIFDIKIVSIK